MKNGTLPFLLVFVAVRKYSLISLVLGPGFELLRIKRLSKVLNNDNLLCYYSVDLRILINKS